MGSRSVGAHCLREQRGHPGYLWLPKNRIVVCWHAMYLEGAIDPGIPPEVLVRAVIDAHAFPAVSGGALIRPHQKNSYFLVQQVRMMIIKRMNMARKYVVSHL